MNQRGTTLEAPILGEAGRGRVKEGRGCSGVPDPGMTQGGKIKRRAKGGYSGPNPGRGIKGSELHWVALVLGPILGRPKGRRIKGF